MAKNHITNVVVLDNPSPFLNPFQFELTFECIEELKEDLEWKMIYVGSAETEEHDQVLDTIYVGPIPEGRHMFVFQAPPPDVTRIPENDALDLYGIIKMFVGDNEGPVFYREIQKNAYLKRIPTDENGKLRPMGHKKPLKPMWTLLCVHNGRVPFLEQYLEPESTAAHRPAWRACLRLSRHVTASIKPHTGGEYDFLVDTEHEPIRMLAPNWDSMQDWVTTLRTKLYDLRSLPPSENLYWAPPAPPAPPAPRAAARDPTSPLPPTPPVPPDRVPGIDTPITRTVEAQNSNSDTTNNNNNNSQSSNTINDSRSTVSTTINATVTSATSTVTSLTSLSSIVTSITTLPPTITSITSLPSTVSALTSLPSTVSALTSLPSTVTSLTSLPSTVTSLTSNLNQADIDISNWDTSSLPSTSRNNEPKQSVAKICGQNICLDDSVLKRTVTDSDEEFFAEIDRIHDNFEFKQRVVVTNETADSSQSTPQRNNVTVIEVSNKTPNTAIPVMGSDNIFDFNFKQNVTINPEQNDFVNIVNTENQNSYGTVFVDNDYGHLSLTTVSLTDDRCVKITEGQSSSNTAEGQSSSNMTEGQSSSNMTEGHSSVKVTDGQTSVNLTAVTDVSGIYERLCMASTSNRVASPLSVRKVLSENKIRKSSLPNLELSESTYEYLYPTSQSSNNSNLEGNSRTDLGNRLVERTQSHNVANESSNIRVIRSNIERSQSQNAYDNSLRQRLQNSPKRSVKQEKSENQPKPIWRRGLTELSLLSRLRGIGQKRQESPTRQDERVTSSVKVVHRSRPETARDSSRRRSSSLTNVEVVPGLQPLRARQAAALRLEQRRGAAAAALRRRDPPTLCLHDHSVWVARWGSEGSRVSGRAGDRVAGIAGSMPVSLAHARDLIEKANTAYVDILFHRVPLAQIYVINKKDREGLGIKLDNECTIVSVEANSPASRAGLPPPGRWAVTEVNNRPVNIVKGGEEDMNRLSYRGSEVSILIQPSTLVKKMRAALKGKPLLSIR